MTPSDGDIRLIRPAVDSTTTKPCDDVHLGVVEVYRGGQWGRICSRGGDQEFTLDAAVICRQIGFPFGNAMDLAAVGDYDDRDSFYGVDEGSDAPIVWATDVCASG